MPTRKDYIIQFAGLSVGQHEFEFDINDKFFEGLDYSEIKQGHIQVDLTLLKQSTMMVLHFNINGTVNMDCDRCTAPFSLPISGNYKLIVKVGGHESGDEDDDIITIAANEHEFDLSQYIYEYISLSLPIKRVHPDDDEGKSTCDKKMLKKLENFLIEEEKPEVDPRWSGLKNIKLN
ncbi:MAG: YceD family protein [Bacteroidota bacterium]